MEKRKKILFVTSGLTHGGVNKSLQNLLGVYDRDNCDIDIYSIYRTGPYNKIFKDESLLDPIPFSPCSSLFCHSKKKYGKQKLKLIDFTTKINIHFFAKRYIEKVGKRLSDNNYDVVVAFQEGFTTLFASEIKAKKHIAWIHCDYSRYISNAKKDESWFYKKYDSIVTVSEYTADVFKSLVPSVAEKVVAIHNIMDDKTILKLGEEHISDERFKDDRFTVISIGRMDPVKRFSSIPSIAAELKNRGVVFRWYVIGDGGSDKEVLIKEIKDKNVGDEVILLGAKNNPYPYINRSKILACVSSSEACPNVVNEAKILHVPVVVTDFPSAKELIVDCENGFIRPINEIYKIIVKLYSDNAFYKTIKKNCLKYRFINKHILEKIYNLING